MGASDTMQFHKEGATVPHSATDHHIAVKQAPTETAGPGGVTGERAAPRDKSSVGGSWGLAHSLMTFIGPSRTGHSPAAKLP